MLLAVLLAACQKYPPTVPIVFGPNQCRPNDTVRFSALSLDPDGDSISYEFDWGDGTASGWSACFPSGREFWLGKVFADTGFYGVVCRSSDGTHESPWSDSIHVRVRDYGPFVPPKPSGPADTLAVLDTVLFATTARHPLGERIAVEFDWGDSSSTWTGFDEPNSIFTARHGYNEAGIFELRARARDSLERFSDWSKPETVWVMGIYERRTTNFELSP